MTINKKHSKTTLQLFKSQEIEHRCMLEPASDHYGQYSRSSLSELYDDDDEEEDDA